MSAADLEPRVRRVVAASGLEATPDDVVAALAAWVALIAHWNRRIDLTASRNDDELVDLMVADAAALAPRVARDARVVDVGSGAGAPGLPLGLLRADLDVTLVEPLQKRIAFLRTALGTIGGPERVRALRGRGEELARRGEAYDVAVSRATLAPDRWLALGAELAGEVWVLLAREAPPALEGWSVADDLRYRWPLTGAERRALRFAKSSTHRRIGEEPDQPEKRDEPERGREKD